MRDDFEASAPEVDTLVELAREAGAVGARVTGAGWGGCTVNLVREDAVPRLCESVLADYRRTTGVEAEAHVCRAVDGLRVGNA